LDSKFEIKDLKIEGKVQITHNADARGRNIGALAGNISGGSNAIISNVVSNVDIESVEADYVGGVIGYAYGTKDSILINNVVNNGDVITSGSNNVGGIIGITGNGTVVSNSANNGRVTADNTAGGIAGVTYGDIIGCYNNGDIFVSGYGAAGIVSNAASSPSIINCYNTGDIEICGSGPESQGTDTDFIGGILANDRSGSVEITNCYNIGAVIDNGRNAASYAGIAGTYAKNVSPTVVTNSYYLSKLPVMEDEINQGTPKTLTEMKALKDTLGDGYEMVSGFDFPQIKDNTNSVNLELIEISVVSEHGTVVLNREYAKQGDAVEFTVNSENGYQISEVKAGNDILNAEDGKYTFNATTDNAYITVLYDLAVVIPSAKLSAFNGKISSLSLTGVSLEKKFEYVGKNAVIIMIEIADGDVTESGYIINGIKYTAKAKNFGDKDVAMFIGNSTDTEVTITPYVVYNEITHEGESVTVTYTPVEF